MRYSGPSCRLCRREGQKLYLKGERCMSPKCAITRRGTPPGANVKKFSKLSEYGRQLREKQKAKRIYTLTESQFQRYYSTASAKKGKATGDLMLTMLEMRLDNVLYRAGFTDSRAQARQYVSHGLFAVNGKTVTVPSYQLKVGETFAIRDKVKASPVFTAKKDIKVQPPTWIDADITNFKGSIKRELVRDDLPSEIDAQLIVEYYSR